MNALRRRPNVLKGSANAVQIIARADFSLQNYDKSHLRYSILLSSSCIVSSSKHNELVTR